MAEEEGGGEGQGRQEGEPEPDAPRQQCGHSITRPEAGTPVGKRAPGDDQREADQKDQERHQMDQENGERDEADHPEIAHRRLVEARPADRQRQDGRGDAEAVIVEAHVDEVVKGRRHGEQAVDAGRRVERADGDAHGEAQGQRKAAQEELLDDEQVEDLAEQQGEAVECQVRLEMRVQLEVLVNDAVRARHEQLQQVDDVEVDRAVLRREVGRGPDRQDRQGEQRPEESALDRRRQWQNGQRGAIPARGESGRTRDRAHARLLQSACRRLAWRVAAA